MSHLMQLADEHDNLIGYKKRDEFLDTDICRIIAVDIHDLSDRYILAQKRSMQKKICPGKWSVAVAGTLEDDDTYESCAIREVEEEIGVIGCLLEMGEKAFRRNDDIGGRQRMLFTTKISMDTTLIPQESEVDEVRWVSREDLQKWTSSTPDDFTKGTLEIWRKLGVIEKSESI